jgi:hypothetical protein
MQADERILHTSLTRRVNMAGAIFYRLIAENSWTILYITAITFVVFCHLSPPVNPPLFLQ